MLQHCAIGDGCHAHPLQTFSGVASGSFSAPDHEYPAYLELTLTATDAGGLTDRKTVRLDPQTVDLGFQTSPPGLQLTVGSAGQATPFTRTVIVGSSTFLSAPSPQTLGGLSYGFQSWSDGLTQGHFVTAPATPATFTATYQEGWVPHARINFQPAGAPVPAGYLADSGAAFGGRGNGFRYGWSGAKRTARDHNSPLSPDQRYDTLIEMEKGNKTATWELAVPNGSYRVHLVSGDPVDLSGSYRLNVEGRTAINGAPTSSNRWLEATVTVTVSDGRLTVSGAAGANGNKVNFIDIEKPG